MARRIPLVDGDAVAALMTDEHDRDVARIALPRPELHVVARFGPVARGGVDLHALGVRTRVHRKLVRGRHRVVMARLCLGSTEAVLGVSASEMMGRVVPLEELWGNAATERLRERLAAAHDAPAVLERAIAERAGTRRPAFGVALDAAARLADRSVNEVARGLGLSERHLRRIFHDAIGIGPKTFAKLARFQRALEAARGSTPVSWARVAADSGYYDQAHLIAEFKAVSGVTPGALLRELRTAAPLGERAGQAA